MVIDSLFQKWSQTDPSADVPTPRIGKEQLVMVSEIERFPVHGEDEP